MDFYAAGRLAALFFTMMTTVNGTSGPIQFGAYNSHSPVRIVEYALGYRWRPNSTDRASYNCVSFANTDPRTIKEVSIHFVVYDANRNLAAQDDVVRKGTFAQGVTIEALHPKTNAFNDEDCVLNPRVRGGIGTVIAFVKGVTYADGSVWANSGPAIPQHLGGDPAPAASP